MFFGTKLPIPTSEKVAIELEFQRLLDHFGIEHLKSQRVFFSDDASLSMQELEAESDVGSLRKRIAAVFGLPENVVDYRFGEANDWSTETGILLEENRFVAQMRRDLLDDKVRVAALLAVCFSAHLLHRTFDVEKLDSETYGMLRELIAIWFGFGPLIAGSAVRTSEAMIAGVDQWQMSRLGVLSAIQAGYVMAIREFILLQRLPNWHTRLTIDAKVSMSKAHKYLQQTGDCLVSESNSCLSWTHAQYCERISSRSASERLAALRYFPANEALDEEELDLVLRSSVDKDVFVRQRAYQLLEFAPAATPELVRAIEFGLDDRDTMIRAGAIRASGVHGHAIEGLGFLLRRILGGNDQDLMVFAAAAMATNDLCDEESLKLLLDKLKRTLVRGSEDSARLISVLGYIHDNPKQLVMEYLQDQEDLIHAAEHLFPTQP